MNELPDSPSGIGGNGRDELAALQPALIEPLTTGGAFTLSLQDAPPYVVQPSPTPSGRAVVLFVSRYAAERFLREHRDLWHEIERAGHERLELHQWRPDRIGYVIDAAAALDRADVLVRTNDDQPELLDVAAAISRIEAVVGRLVPREQRPTPIPPASATMDVARGRGGPTFTMRF